MLGSSHPAPPATLQGLATGERSRPSRLAISCAFFLSLVSLGCEADPSTGPLDAGAVTPTDGGASSDAGRLTDASPDGDSGLTDAGSSHDTDAGMGDRPEDYPEDPTTDLTEVAGTPVVYRGTSRYGDGMAQFQVWVPPGYTREERWPLAIHLHGGGNRTDTEESLSSGASALRTASRRAEADKLIWMAGVVRTPGSYHAWAHEPNALDLIDAIREVAARFRIDHTRVYLQGTSMGGGGVATLSYLMPRAFAAFAPVVGYYWNDLVAAPDLTGVSYRVLAGELDRPPAEPFDRLGLAQHFATQTMAAGATVELVVMEDVGHFYPASEADLTNAFFLTHALATPTDWESVRTELDAVLPLFSM